MLDIDYFRKIQGTYGFETKKDAVLAQLQRNVAKHFGDTIDCEDVIIHEQARRLLVIHIANDPYRKQIIAFPGEDLKRGWLVDCYGSKWLITEVDSNRQVYSIGKMQQCNRELIWKNPQTGEILSRWCSAEKPYTANIKDGEVVSVSNREYKVQLPYDSETCLIDIDRRFLLDKINGEPKSYKVTSVDSITNRYDAKSGYEDGSDGFLILNLRQDQYNPVYDNAELMVANYYGYPPTEENGESAPPPPAADCTITCTGAPEIKTGGTAKTFAAHFYSADGEELSGILAAWTLDCPPDAAGYITFTTDGNTVKLRAANEAGLIGTLLKLQATADGGYYAEIEVKVVGGI